jgi:PE family
MLGESSAAAAGPTTAVAAAAEDQVSAGVAALFGSFGEEYQVINAQLQAFHEQFVNLLSAGAGAYLSTEAANAGQALANASNAPVQALLGGASASGAAAASSAAAVGTIAAPYQSLVANTATNLQGIGDTWSNVTAPALLRAITAPTNAPLIISALEGGSLPILSLTGQIAQGYANLLSALAVPVSLSITSVSSTNASVAIGFSLPEVLAFDALGAPVNASLAASASSAAIFNAVQTGNPLAAAIALVDAPANVANAFLNGESTLPVPLPLPGLSLTAEVPFGGLLVPLQPLTATETVVGNPL